MSVYDEIEKHDKKLHIHCAELMFLNEDINYFSFIHYMLAKDEKKISEFKAVLERKTKTECAKDQCAKVENGKVIVGNTDCAKAIASENPSLTFQDQDVKKY